METKTDTPSLGRQLLGAGIGATVALTLYAGYTQAEPVVTAYIMRSDDVQEAHFAQKNLDHEDRQYQRQAVRNIEVAGHGAAPDEDLFEKIAERAREIEEEYTEIEAEAILEDEEDVQEVPAAPAVEEVIVPAVPSPEAWEREIANAPHEEFASEGDLPDSGVGLWMGIIVALTVAATLHRRTFFEMVSRLRM